LLTKEKKIKVISTKKPSFTQKYIQYFILAGIIFMAIALRWVTADFEMIGGPDSWWFYRHAQEIYSNHFQLPQWDALSYYPPGRPFEPSFGWSYTLAIFYAITQPFFPDLTLMKFSGLFVAVFASWVAIPAYLVGRMITNKWGGLTSALFAVLSPRFVLLSVAGVPDSDSVVVFYTFVAVLTTFYAIKKANKLDFGNFKNFYMSLIKYLPYTAPALLAYWLFAVNWSFSWYIYFIFLFFIPILILFKLLEAKIFRRESGFFSLTFQKIRESRNIIIPVVLIGLLGELISLFTHQSLYFIRTLDQQLIHGLSFLRADTLELAGLAILFTSLGVITGLSVSRVKGLLIGGAIGFIISILLLSSGISEEISLVDRSVSELQVIKLSLSGFGEISRTTGGAPIIFGVIGISGILLSKLIKKREITAFEYFLLFWIIVGLFLVTAGTRFSLLLLLALAVAGGFTIGHLVEFAKSRKRIGLAPQLYGLIIVGIVLLVADNVNYAYTLSGAVGIPQGWIDGLTWLKENADKNSLILTCGIMVT